MCNCKGVKRLLATCVAPYCLGKAIGHKEVWLQLYNRHVFYTVRLLPEWGVLCSFSHDDHTCLNCCSALSGVAKL